MKGTKILLLLVFAFACVLAQQRTNKAGYDLIKSFEGWFPNFYKDPVKIRTIGYGHACHVNDCNKLMAKSATGAIRQVFAPLSKQDGDDLLRYDLENVGYENCVRTNVKRAINDNQFSALVSFVFNIGCNGFKSSTLLKRINSNSGDIRAAFAMWNKGDGGRILPGLTRRRAAEADLYLKGTSVAASSTTTGGNECRESSTGRKGLCKNKLTSTCAPAGEWKSNLCPGPAEITCCLSFASGASTLNWTLDNSYFCPAGSQFEISLGYCQDSLTWAYGPFTQVMTDACKAQTSNAAFCTDQVAVSVGGNSVSVQKWNYTLAESLRGNSLDCMVGSAVDPDFLGRCTETIVTAENETIVYLYGPFEPEEIAQCQSLGGGNSCWTNRWLASIFLQTQGSQCLTPDCSIQANVAQEADDSAGMFIVPSVLFATFLSLFLIFN